MEIYQSACIHMRSDLDSDDATTSAHTWTCYLQCGGRIEHIQWRSYSFEHASCGVSFLDSSCTLYHLPDYRPNIFRSPPREQAQYERYSLAFFTRPHDSVVLEPLVPTVGSNTETGQDRGTAGEWLVRRLKFLRTGNYQVSQRYIESWVQI